METYITKVQDIVKAMFSHKNIDKTAKEIFASTPPVILRRLIRLSRKVRLPDLPSPSVSWDYNFCILMCERAKQTLAGIWKKKEIG